MELSDLSTYLQTNTWLLGLTALVLYQVFQWLNVKRLHRQLGTKPIEFIDGDYVWGFYIWYPAVAWQRSGRILEFNEQVWDKHSKKINGTVNTFIFQILGRNLIQTRDPENIKAILATQFNDFNLGSRAAITHPLIGDGIFSLDGEGWKQSRALLRPQFAREQIGHVQLLEPYVLTLASIIKGFHGKPFDLQDLFYKFTVDTSTKFLFGSSVNTMEDFSKSMGITSANDFTNSFNSATKTLALRALAQSFYWAINSKKFRQNCHTVHQFTDFYVAKALKMSDEELNSQPGYTFLFELAKQTKNPRLIRDQLLNILLAGRDTTSVTMSCLFLELARNESIWTKLRQEIDENFGTGENSIVDDINFESLKKCVYLKAVINETLRMYPVVPKNIRTAAKNTTLPRGGGPEGLDPILVRKGETLLYTAYSLHRLQEFYGKDSNTFRPERWFEPEYRKLGWAYVPFNGGPRICLGQQFALTEIGYVVARLAQMFTTLRPLDEDYPPLKNSDITLSLFNGCNISMS